MHKQDHSSLARAISRFHASEIKKIIYQARLVYSDDGFDIKIKPTKRPFGRILIITPRKIGSAPERNLLKRRLKALFYENTWYDRGHNLVIFCKKGSIQRTFEQLRSMLSVIFAKIS